VYIRTNDNSDDTVEILEQFVKDYRGEYARMLLNTSNVDWLALGLLPPDQQPTTAAGAPAPAPTATSTTKLSMPAVTHNGADNETADQFDANQHLNFDGKWNERKLRLMGSLRQNTLDQAWTWKTDCFFVADADNFGNVTSQSILIFLL
jgi:hypothetical protein